LNPAFLSAILFYFFKINIRYFAVGFWLALRRTTLGASGWAVLENLSASALRN
jgi:predicted ABC-type sugar transport system permease subunit